MGSTLRVLVVVVADLYLVVGFWVVILLILLFCYFVYVFLVHLVRLRAFCVPCAWTAGALLCGFGVGCLLLFVGCLLVLIVLL